MFPAFSYSVAWKRGYIAARRYCRLVRHQADFEHYSYPTCVFHDGWNAGLAAEERKLLRKWGMT